MLPHSYSRDSEAGPKAERSPLAPLAASSSRSLFAPRASSRGIGALSKPASAQRRSRSAHRDARHRVEPQARSSFQADPRATDGADQELGKRLYASVRGPPRPTPLRACNEGEGRGSALRAGRAGRGEGERERGGRTRTGGGSRRHPPPCHPARGGGSPRHHPRGGRGRHHPRGAAGPDRGERRGPASCAWPGRSAGGATASARRARRSVQERGGGKVRTSAGRWRYSRR